MHSTSRMLLLAAACLMGHSAVLRAQTIEDGYMLARHELRTAILYSHDSWDQYWEGARKRSNDNIGTLTTQTAAWTANYGVTDRLNVLTIVPYVSTHASKGVLTGMEGFQDLTVAAKYRLLEKSFTSYGTLRAMAALSGAVPLSRYTPDFQPLSIGTASKRVAGRTTLHFQAERGWLLDASAAYTWRDNVSLDRSSYFTDGRLFLTN